MIEYNKLMALVIKRSKKYNTSVEFLNDTFKMGLSKHACMTMELLMLNRPYDRIKHVLLFTDDGFEPIVGEIEDLLKNFKQKQKMLKIGTNR